MPDLRAVCRHKFDGVFDMHGVKTGSGEDLPGFLEKLRTNRYFAMDFWEMAGSLSRFGSGLAAGEIRETALECVAGGPVAEQDPVVKEIEAEFDAHMGPRMVAEASNAEAVEERAGEMSAGPAADDVVVAPDAAAGPAYGVGEDSATAQAEGGRGMDDALSRLEINSNALRLHLDEIDSRMKRIEPRLADLASQVGKKPEGEKAAEVRPLSAPAAGLGGEERSRVPVEAAPVFTAAEVSAAEEREPRVTAKAAGRPGAAKPGVERRRPPLSAAAVVGRPEMRRGFGLKSRDWMVAGVVAVVLIWLFALRYRMADGSKQRVAATAGTGAAGTGAAVLPSGAGAAREERASTMTVVPNDTPARAGYAGRVSSPQAARSGTAELAEPTATYYNGSPNGEQAAAKPSAGTVAGAGETGSGTGAGVGPVGTSSNPAVAGSEGSTGSVSGSRGFERGNALRGWTYGGGGSRSVSVSSGVMAANLLQSTAPGYPMLAKVAHVQGPVVLQVFVSKRGTVDHINVVKGHHLLRGAAESAVRRWRYRPYLLNGRPVEVATIVTVDFQLGNK